MAVPDYETVMLPLLKFAADRKKHTIPEAVEHLSAFFHLSDEDMREMLPSGQSYTFANRVGWARTYLKKAQLLHSPERGVFEITNRGIALLEENPLSINNTVLQRFEEFREFRTRKKDSIAANGIRTGAVEERTPEEILEEGVTSLFEALSAELLDKVKSASPTFFERLVVDLLLKMGYGGSRKDAGKAVGRSGDGGVDGIIKQDKLGLDVIYIQAKRWEGTVGRADIQKFAGSLEGERARRGIFISTSQYSKEARDYVNQIEKKIVLIDGQELAKLMIDHGLACSTVATYEVKKIDNDYFEEA